MSTEALSTQAAVLPSPADITDVTATVWACYVDDQAMLVPALAEGPQETYATVHINGAWNGWVTMSLAETSARLLAEQMTRHVGLMEVSPNEVLAELINIIGGNVKSLLPEPSVLSLPVVSDVAPEDPFAAIEHVDIEWAGQILRVTVAVDSPAPC